MPKRYDIEGELLTWREIRARVPASIKTCTLQARLIYYRRRTWAALTESPTHRPRPEQRADPPAAAPKRWNPAYPHIS